MFFIGFLFNFTSQGKMLVAFCFNPNKLYICLGFTVVENLDLLIYWFQKIFKSKKCRFSKNLEMQPYMLNFKLQSHENRSILKFFCAHSLHICYFYF